jgi:hypothetical protein
LLPHNLREPFQTRVQGPGFSQLKGGVIESLYRVLQAVGFRSLDLTEPSVETCNGLTSERSQHSNRCCFYVSGNSDPCFFFQPRERKIRSNSCDSGFKFARASSRRTCGPHS